MDSRGALIWGRGDTSRIETSKIPLEVLALVDRRQGGRFCVECRRLRLDPPPGEPLEIDHKQPRSCGGDNHHSNLQWLCRSHNRARCNRPLTGEPIVPQWRRRQQRPKRPKA